jgi:serine/threonine protein kinase
MSDPSSDRNPVEELAEEFLERCRRGERPSLTEYTDKCPSLAGEIRDLFPALLMMEDVRPGKEDAGSSEPGRSPGSQGKKLERLGDYRILREVGRGGMGVVYEAEQESLGRHVALKVLPGHALLDPQRLRRFQREARSAARLHHTNIVPVFGVGEDDGLHYYVMQFIPGQSLDQVLAELWRLKRSKSAATVGPENQAAVCPAGAVTAVEVARGLLTGVYKPAEADFELAEAKDELGRTKDERKDEKDRIKPSDSSLIPHPSSLASQPLLPGQTEHTTPSDTGRQYWQSVARLGIQVADALAYAHSQGTLHRDIKPSNLLLDPQGTVWVTDFGLAKAAESDDLTHTGDIVGTVRYMAPERFGAKSDVRSDLYGLGITLYEMLTLRPAFAETDRSKLVAQILHQEPPRPRKLNPLVPRDLETIVLKTMAKEPGHRYVSAAELAEDLKRFTELRPIRARRVSAAERLWRWSRRNPGLASALGLVAASLLAVAVVSTLSAVWHKGKRDEVAEAERKARLREADALVGQAHGTRLSRRPGQRFDALAALDKAAAIGRELGQPPEWFDRLRNEAIAALALPDIHITTEWDGFPPGTVWVELSDDFELYVRTTETGLCTIHRVVDNVEVARLPELGEKAGAVFGSGRILGVRGDSSGRFQLWDLSGAEPVLRLKERGVAPEWRFRNDGRLLALGHKDHSVSVFEVATAKRLHRLPPSEVPTIHLHPAGSYAAGAYYHSRTIQVRDLRTGEVVASALGPGPMGNGACAWSPDGLTLTVPSGDGGAIQQYAFDAAVPALRLLRTIQGHEAGGAQLTYNPAGDRLVRRGWDGTVSLFDGLSGQLLFSTHPLPSASYECPRFDGTGQRLAAARVGERNERVGLWSVADGREYRALIHSGGRESTFFEPAIHPSGRLAAIGRNDGVALFDLETGHELAQFPVLPGRTVAAFDGTGALLTNGFDGFFRWPVRPDPAEPGRWIVGPPERLPFHGGEKPISASRDGQVIAQCMWAGYGMQDFAGGWILHPNSPVPRRVEAGESTGYCSVSPDGRWVAFSTPDRVAAYDAATGQRVWQASTRPANYYCRFTPNGRWLVTSADGGRLYAVGTWEPGPRLGPGTPWDVTSELAVLGQSNGIYRLVELATGRELARLEDPEQNTGEAGFTTDATRLVVRAKNGLRVWELRRIREELDKLGLDWDAPPYPPAALSSPPPAPGTEQTPDTRPLKARLDLGQLIGPSAAANLLKNPKL